LFLLPVTTGTAGRRRASLRFSSPRFLVFACPQFSRKSVAWASAQLLLRLLAQPIFTLLLFLRIVSLIGSPSHPLCLPLISASVERSQGGAEKEWEEEAAASFSLIESSSLNSAAAAPEE
jgi:hypothetical protein